MNQTRSFLLIAWLFVAAYLFIQWNSWSAAQNAPAAVLANDGKASSAPTAAPAALPASRALPAALPGAGANTNAPVAAAANAPRLITVSNDTLRLSIDLAGGRVVGAQLLQYTLEKKPGSPNVVLFDTTPARPRRA
jgi:YidC/Oxa1 family membrane protein insertase